MEMALYIDDQGWQYVSFFYKHDSFTCHVEYYKISHNQVVSQQVAPHIKDSTDSSRILELILPGIVR